MDSDSTFTLDRPHISVLDAIQFASLFERKEAPIKNEHSGDTDLDFVNVINRTLDIGIRYPLNDDTFPSISPRTVRIPVNITNDKQDPVNFRVYPREGKKRKRAHGDTMVMSLRIMKFQEIGQEVVVLDELQRPSKRNRMIENWVQIDWPVLHLWVQEHHRDHLIINGKIEYRLGYRVEVNPPVFMLEVPGIRKLMEYLIPPENSQPITPQLLYQSIISKNKTKKLADKSIVVPGMECKLLRYQRETVRWLLAKEGKMLTENDELTDSTSKTTWPCWKKWENDYYCNPYSGCIADYKKLQNETKHSAAQILLAEEMGLGKTVETIAVMLLNRRPGGAAGAGASSEPSKVYDSFLDREVLASKGTLIISPQSIANQWKDEIEMHAPSLSVLIYRGRGVERGDVLARRLANYDVVITNYRTISQEVHYAFYNPPARVRSHVVQKRDVEAIQSPLVQMQFWRVILDEVQMVSSGVSDAAKVAKIIPRVHAWGVTGTPVNRNMSDLRGILNFLRYEPHASSNHAWNRFNLSRTDFQELFGDLGMRHTTAMVEDDISIPPQSRVLVPLRFNQIEANNYHHLYESFLQNCGVDSEGAPVGDYRPDQSMLSQWLIRLRQACCHARIGVNKRALGGKPMNTMQEVLDAMIEQSNATLLANQRKYFVSQIERGQIREQEHDPRGALAIWQDALREIERIVEQLKQEVVAGSEEKKEEGKKVKEEENGDDDDDDEDDEDERKSVQRIRVRSWNELVHRCYFFIASAHFQLYRKPDTEKEGQEEQKLENGKSDAESNGEMAHSVNPESTEEKETKNDSNQTEEKQQNIPELTEEEKYHQQKEQEFYEKAELLRRSILQEPIKKVQKSTEKLQEAAKAQNFVEINDAMLDEKLEDVTGIETHGFVQKFNIIAESLNQQAELIDHWRELLIKFLTSKLVDQNADPDGEEYNESLDAQEFAFIYLEVLQQVLSDRSQAVIGVADPIMSSSSVPKEDRTEKQIELEAEREKVKPVDEESATSLNGIVNECRTIGMNTSSGGPRAALEQRLAAQVTPSMSKIVSTQRNSLKKLSKEVVMLRDVYNQRVEYYRQLQEISDNVVALEENYEGSFQTRVDNEAKLMSEINQQLGRMRYLVNLDMKQEEERVCIICQTTYTLGSWTICGHDFCRACLTEWWNSKKTCPICKRVLRADEVYNYLSSSSSSGRPTGIKSESNGEDRGPNSEQENHNGSKPNSNSSDDTKHAIYSELSEEKIREIDSMTTVSEFRYGTKIDFMIRHLLWLREFDPAAQVVIFSQWKEMLGLIERALEDNKILYAAVGNNQAHNFKKNPKIACFLLHAKSQS